MARLWQRLIDCHGFVATRPFPACLFTHCRLTDGALSPTFSRCHGRAAGRPSEQRERGISACIGAPDINLAAREGMSVRATAIGHCPLVYVLVLRLGHSMPSSHTWIEYLHFVQAAEAGW